jgi:hypothetical protein
MTTATIHNFEADLAAENSESTALFWSICYARLFPGICGQRIAPKGSAEQRAGIDRFITLASGETVSIQEKTRKRTRRDLLIELRHVAADGRTWAGWLSECKANYLLYVFRDTGECRLWTVQELRHAALINHFRWQRIFRVRIAKNKGYESINVPVPFSELPEPQTCQVNPRLFRVKDTTAWAAGRSD